jgi:Zn-dependent protease
MSDNLARFILFLPVFLFSLSFHECAHAWTANKLGDSTARLMGRMTLNPWPHIDIFGTILFPLLMFLSPGLLLFGWAKPVPVNPYKLRGGRMGNLKVSIAGPVSNLILAAIFAALLHSLVALRVHSTTMMIVAQMLQAGVYLNLVLAFFNLIPIPPLDGGGVMEGLLPEKYLHYFDQLRKYGFLILIAALYLGILKYLTIPVFFFANVLLP